MTFTKALNSKASQRPLLSCIHIEDIINEQDACCTYVKDIDSYVDLCEQCSGKLIDSSEWIDTDNQTNYFAETMIDNSIAGSELENWLDEADFLMLNDFLVDYTYRCSDRGTSFTFFSFGEDEDNGIELLIIGKALLDNGAVFYEGDKITRLFTQK
mgnify:CR=1 FL=1